MHCGGVSNFVGNSIMHSHIDLVGKSFIVLLRHIMAVLFVYKISFFWINSVHHLSSSLVVLLSSLLVLQLGILHLHQPLGRTLMGLVLGPSSKWFTQLLTWSHFLECSLLNMCVLGLVHWIINCLSWLWALEIRFMPHLSWRRAWLFDCSWSCEHVMVCAIGIFDLNSWSSFLGSSLSWWRRSLCEWGCSLDWGWWRGFFGRRLFCLSSVSKFLKFTDDVNETECLTEVVFDGFDLWGSLI